ncbi:MAG: histidine phosphatase family protein [Phenylobacterium sp.]|uniref:histidine phosphatase family protein n=1 Tax=Phenylobacterium sp. TaxID=1871053 RepID=UPI00391CF2A3
MIYLVRHGQTAFNRDGRLQGHVDSELTDLGLEQARRVGERLRALVGEEMGWRIVASPLGRARTTAEHIARALGGAAVEVHAELTEVSFGAWDGRLREELRTEYPDAFSPTGYMFTAPACETYEAVCDRLTAWLAGLEPEPGRRVIAVSHGVSGRVLRGLYAGLSREAALALPVPQDAVFRLAGGLIERIEA